MKKYLLNLILPLMALGMFTACSDIPEPYYVLNPEDANVTIVGSGTYDDPYTVKDALALINSGKYTSDKVYVKGIVTRIDEIGGQFGNATYFIADEEDLDEDGIAASEKQLEIYRGLGISGDNFTSERDLQSGDYVVVYGQLTLYGSTPEITQGSMLCVHNDVDNGPYESNSQPEGSGTYDDPYNVAAAQELIANGAPEEKVYVHGIVSRINEIGGSFGNATYFISDDGTAAGQLEVFRGLGLGGAPFTGNGDLEVGDEVTVYGVLVLYGGNTPEFTQGSFLIERNGQKIDEPSDGKPSGSGTLEDPYNAAAANQLAESLSAGEYSDVVYIKGKVASIKENYNSGFGNATFYISDDGGISGQFYIYRALYLGNQNYTQGEILKVGDDVVICGKVMKYSSQYGTTLETVQYEAYLYSLNGQSGGEPGPQAEPMGSGTLEDPYNAAAAIQVCKNLGKDGTTPEPVYIKGKVSSIKENYNGGWGNATFWISDDGSSNTQFYIFRSLYLNNVEYKEGPLLEVGDDVIIYGKLTYYQGNTPETVQKESYLYSLNGKGPDEPEEPKPTSGEGEGTYENPYNVEAAQSLYDNGGKGLNKWVEGIIVGYVNGNKFNEETVVFDIASSQESEILIADNPQPTWNECLPIQLPRGDFRDRLDLSNRQLELRFCHVKIYGTIENYFGVAGIKPPTYVEVYGMNGNLIAEIGTKPEVKRR